MLINSVSKKFNVPAHTLRYWEKASVIPPVNKDSQGRRNYNQVDLDWIGFAICMRNADIGISDLKTYISLMKKGRQTVPVRRQLLIKHRQSIRTRISKLQKSYKLLGYKLKHCGDVNIRYLDRFCRQYSTY